MTLIRHDTSMSDASDVQPLTYAVTGLPAGSGAGKPDGVEVKVQSIGDDGLLISLLPPEAPPTPIKHTPCDIVLVIDVSASMQTGAPLPGSQEQTGLTILDLTKHCAKMIIQTLDDGDRLGLVSFSSRVKELSPLVHMTKEAKEDMIKKVTGLRVEDSTNLWGGIKAGLAAFRNAEEVAGSTRAIMLLTDGQPNFMCPGKGYIPSLAPLLQKMKEDGHAPVQIDTFGFGYDIRSGLLRSISAISQGSYAFMPGSEMMGTVFVHAAANLYTTYKPSVTINFEAPKDIWFEVEGAYEVISTDGDGVSTKYHSISIGNLLYGQPRDFIVRAHSQPDQTRQRVNITTSVHNFARGAAELLSIAHPTSLDGRTEQAPDAERLFHEARLSLCAFIEAIEPVETELSVPAPGPYRRDAPPALDPLRAEIAGRIARIKEQDCQDPAVLAILADFEGQVSLALSCDAYYTRWGRHYLKSLFNAHQKQMCNSFKDPGPLLYGAGSGMFVRCRDELNEVFDEMPPPVAMEYNDIPLTRSGYAPPGGVPGAGTGIRRPMMARMDMRAFNNRDAPCFTGRCLVEMGDGTWKAVGKLRPGMVVKTKGGAQAKVEEVVKTESLGAEMCRIGKLEITPWHPISTDGLVDMLSVNERRKAEGLGAWCFAADIVQPTASEATALYSVLLEKSADPDAHCISVESVWAVTLGHGHVRKEEGSVRAHRFLGDWDAVSRSLGSLPRDAEGRRLCAGLMRDEKSGLAMGFATD